MRRFRGRRRRSVGQWVTMGQFNVSTNLVNASTTSLFLSAFTAQGVQSVANVGFVPERVTLQRIVGDVFCNQQSSTANCSYFLEYGITRYMLAQGAVSALDMHSVADIQGPWMFIKRTLLIAAGNAPAFLATDPGYVDRFGCGPMHVDVHVKRKLEPNQVLLLVVRATQTGGVAQAIQFTPYLRGYVTRVG